MGGNSLDLQNKPQSTKMQQFYEGKVLLLTGGTGFLGKVVIEKLLRSCPNIGHIYLLVREKDGQSAEERLKALSENDIFSRLKSENPKFAEKLSVVHGELHKPKLGLSEHHAALLSQNVDIVVHSAASVRFNEQLRTAISTKLCGTKQLCLLARDMVRLKVLVYVSTAFSNSDSAVIPERVCPPPVSPDTLILLSELLDNRLLNDITPSLLGSKPNTYVYTKNAAEMVVKSFIASFPVAILRPSIVAAALSEPLPGWVDNDLGATQVVASTLKGNLRTFLFNNHVVANLVPVDYTANAILALVYSVATQQWQSPKDEEIPVVNFVPTENNTMTWGQFVAFVEKYARLYPSTSLMWYPFLYSTQSQWLAQGQRLLLHYLPARIIDFFATVCSRPARMRQIYSRLDLFVEVVKCFTCQHFQFQKDNQRLLWESLEPRDQQEFPFNMADVSWDLLMDCYMQGCRQHVLREQPDTLPRARQRLRWLYVIHLVTKTMLLLASANIVWIMCGHLYHWAGNFV